MPPPEVLEVEDVQKIMRAAEAERNGALVPYLSLCVFAGLRPSEAEQVTWEMVNLKDGQIRLEGRITKTGKPRVVAVSDQLDAWLRSCEGKTFYADAHRLVFAAVRQKAGFGPGLKKWVPDVLRHSYISALLRKSKSYIEVAQQCGNSEKIIREHYEARVSTEYADKFFGIGPRGG